MTDEFLDELEKKVDEYFNNTSNEQIIQDLIDSGFEMEEKNEK